MRTGGIFTAADDNYTPPFVAAVEAVRLLASASASFSTRSSSASIARRAMADLFILSSLVRSQTDRGREILTATEGIFKHDMSDYKNKLTILPSLVSNFLYMLVIF